MMNKNAKFNKLVAKWFKEGKLYFTSCTGELKLVIEFAGGAEPVGDDNSSFSWQDLMNMAEEQGLALPLFPFSVKEA